MVRRSHGRKYPSSYESIKKKAEQSDVFGPPINGIVDSYLVTATRDGEVNGMAWTMFAGQSMG